MEDLIKNEICFRELSLPSDIRANNKALVKWLALSIGLINPGDKRDGIVDVFAVLVEGLREAMPLTIEEITRRASRRRDKAISEKTAYYHIKRLKDMGLVSKVKAGYILGDGHERELGTIIRKVYEERLNKMLSTIEEIQYSI